MPFVGVNQHRQSILLGCALMSSEDITSYKIVLSTWLRGLNNVHLLAIMTDQCDSIKAAINAMMPNTVHRYCIWHMLAKLRTKLSRVLDGKIAKAEFKALVFDNINVVEFERRWTDYIKKYNLEERDWFYKLYLEKEKWVPVYLNDHFWDGMLSTQRSEGMHAFFDGFITRQSTLKLFVQQYELAIRAKFEKELEAEYRSRCFEPKCLSEFVWEEKFQTCYTREVFEFFQVQLRKLYHCEISTPEDHQAIAGVENYIILDYSFRRFNTRDPFVFTVEYTPIGEYLSCSCKWFETRGILCCHILKALSHRRINNVNERYILRRWRKDVVHPHLKRFFLGGYSRMTSEYMMYRELLKHFERVCDIALDTEVMRRYIKYHLNRLEHDLLNWDDDQMIIPDWEFEDTHDGEGEGEGDEVHKQLVEVELEVIGGVEVVGRCVGRGGGRGHGRGCGRGGGRGGGNTGLAEGIEQDDGTIPPQSSLPDLNDEANWEIEDLTV
ncbi:protein FAR-RED IMPAIRED RESPONSE 1-like [Nicotiana sylvestris]